MDVTVNRINLTISYFPCMELLEQCDIYELWFEIELHDENRNIVNATTVVPNYRIDNGSKVIFPRSFQFLFVMGKVVSGNY